MGKRNQDYRIVELEFNERTHLKILKRANYRRMAWKNGLGATEEIAVDPPEIPFTEGKFRWRLSAATVESEGPFSEFPGCDRWLTVWEGLGITLNGDYLPRGDVRRFAGEIPMVGVPQGGAITDLGLIFRRELVAEAHMETLIWKQGEAGLPTMLGTCFLFCAAGRIESAAGCLEEGDCLRLENPAESKFRAATDAVLILVKVIA